MKGTNKMSNFTVFLNSVIHDVFVSGICSIFQHLNLPLFQFNKFLLNKNLLNKILLNKNLLNKILLKLTSKILYDMFIKNLLNKILLKEYLIMGKQLKTIYLDDELIEQISTDKGKFNSRVEELIRTALAFEQGTSKDTFMQLLCIAKKLNDDRKNGLIEFKGQWFGWDKNLHAPFTPQTHYLWGFWVVLSNEQLFKIPKNF